MTQVLRPKLWAPLVLVLGGVGALAATQGAPVEAADHNDPPLRVHGAVSPATDDRASDIADVFAWTRGTGTSQTTVLALSFDGPNLPTALTAVPCDRDVLYQIHITSDFGVCPATVDDGGTPVACTGRDATHPCGQYTPAGGSPTDCTQSFTDLHTINVRFAHNGTGTACYVEAEFVAASGTPIAPIVAGPVETNLVRGSTSVFAGVRDDAFFFDLAGFQQTLATGLLSVHNDTAHDTFAGQNTPVIVLEFPTSAITFPALALGDGHTFRVWASTSRFTPAAT